MTDTERYWRLHILDEQIRDCAGALDIIADSVPSTRNDLLDALADASLEMVQLLNRMGAVVFEAKHLVTATKDYPEAWKR